MKNFIRYLIVVCLICGSLIQDKSQAFEGESLPFDCQYNLISYSSETGLVKIEVKIIQMFSHEGMTACDKLEVHLKPVDDLEYFSDLNWEVEIDENNPFTKVIDVQVPVNDTSGIIFNLTCIKFESPYPLYIMAINDTALFVLGNPLYQHPLQQYGTPEEEAQRSLKQYEEANRIYEEEQKKLLAHKPKQTTQPIAPFTRADSLFYDSLTVNGKKTFAKMKYLELQGPSTERHGESALIDNYGFSRDSGQTYFYRVKSVTKAEMRADSRHRRDSLLAVNPPNVYDVIVDLRNHEDYLFVKDKVDLIEKTERDGFYRILCKKLLLKDFEDRKIQYKRTHRPL